MRAAEREELGAGLTQRARERGAEQAQRSEAGARLCDNGAWPVDSSRATHWRSSATRHTGRAGVTEDSARPNANDGRASQAESAKRNPEARRASRRRAPRAGGIVILSDREYLVERSEHTSPHWRCGAWRSALLRSKFQIGRNVQRKHSFERGGNCLSSIPPTVEELPLVRCVSQFFKIRDREVGISVETVGTKLENCFSGGCIEGPVHQTLPQFSVEERCGSRLSSLRDCDSPLDLLRWELRSVSHISFLSSSCGLC